MHDITLATTLTEYILLLLIFFVSMGVGFLVNVKIPEFQDRIANQKRKTSKFSHLFK